LRLGTELLNFVTHVAREKNYFTRESSSDTKSAAKVPTKA